eukprot:EC685646.1.p2 GENE.EC685646.1~~EC685646.1.p2  ORF type:complete len:127 (+),score=45.02 EC685646.1:70-450(+)
MLGDDEHLRCISGHHRRCRRREGILGESRRGVTCTVFVECMRTEDNERIRIPRECDADRHGGAHGNEENSDTHPPVPVAGDTRCVVAGARKRLHRVFVVLVVSTGCVVVPVEHEEPIEGNVARVRK